MLRKTLAIVCVLLALVSAAAFADTDYFQLEESENGVVVVTYPIEPDVRYKAMLKKDGVKYYYDLTSDHVRLPLQMGEGSYELAILKNKSGKTYAYEYQTTFEVESILEERVYLNSIAIIEWFREDIAIQYLESIITPDMSEKMKLEIIHKYLTETMIYDYVKFSQIRGAYLPDINETFILQTGICYDFSSILAAMLRSEGIQTKLIMGYRADTAVYHAWNEVYVDGNWQIVDLTLDVEYFQKGYGYELYKDSYFYEEKAEY